MLKGKSINFRISCVAATYFLLLLLSVTACTSRGNINNSATSSTANTVSSDERISLFDNRVSFVPPADLKQLTSEQVTAKFPNDEGLRYVFANGSGTGQVLIYLTDIDLKPEKLPEVKRYVERTHRDYSGWLTSEIVTMNGRQWFHFEWKKPVIEDSVLTAPVPIDGQPEEARDERPLHYNEYTTSFNSKPLRFDFESLADEYPQVKDAFMKSAQTIQIKD